MDAGGKAETQLTNELSQLEKQLNPMEELRKRMEQVKRLFDERRISADTYRKVARLQDQINIGFSYTKAMVGTARQHMADTFANFVTTGCLELGAMVDGILKDLARLMAQKAFVALVDAGLSAFGGGSTSSLSLGGAHAAGGPVRAAQAHLVGELGPELFIPSSSGRIVPNEALGGGDVQIPISVTVHSDGSTQVSSSEEGGRPEAERLGKRIGDAIRKVMRKEMALGGMTYTFVRGR